MPAIHFTNQCTTHRQVSGIEKSIGEDFRQAQLWVKNGNSINLVHPFPYGRVDTYRTNGKGDIEFVETTTSIEYSISLRKKLFEDWSRELGLLPTLPWHLGWQSIHDIRKSALMDIDDYLLALLVQYGFKEFKEKVAEFKKKYDDKPWYKLNILKVIWDELALTKEFFKEHNMLFKEAPTYYKELYNLKRIPLWEWRKQSKYYIEAVFMIIFPVLPFIKPKATSTASRGT